MIRLKCPKCATTLSLDDSEAGQVGKCTDCGAKFRVPAKKAGATGRPTKETAKASTPAKRPRDDEDDEDEENTSRPKKEGKTKTKANDAKSSKVTLVALVPIIILLGLGSIYINRLGIIVAGVSIVLMLASGLMVYRTSIKENTSLAIMAVAYLVLAGAAIGGTFLREDILEAKRKETRELILKTPAPGKQATPKT